MILHSARQNQGSWKQKTACWVKVSNKKNGQVHGCNSCWQGTFHSSEEEKWERNKKSIEIITLY